jgi:hypothetical protein
MAIRNITFDDGRAAQIEAELLARYRAEGLPASALLVQQCRIIAVTVATLEHEVMDIEESMVVIEWTVTI